MKLAVWFKSFVVSTKKPSGGGQINLSRRVSYACPSPKNYMIVTESSRQGEMGEWLCTRFGGVKSETPVQYVGKEIEGRLVAVAAYNNYTPRTIFIHIAGEGKGNWFTRDFRWYIFWYPFQQLGVKRLIAAIEYDNRKCITFAKHLGFEELFVKGTIRVFLMRKDTCKWLKEV